MEFGLKGRHVALLAADGTDVVQVNGLRDALREAGAVADVVGARAGRVQGPTDSSLSIERTFDACHAADYEALVIAGGASGAQSLRADSRALQFVKEFMAADKPVAAVGDGIELLVAADAVAGRTIAVRSDRANAIRDAGGEVAANSVHVDEKLVTARDGSNLSELNAVMLREFANRVDEARVDQLSEQSFPASDPPPGPVAVGGEGASRVLHLDPGEPGSRGSADPGARDRQ
jgi:protease I